MLDKALQILNRGCREAGVCLEESTRPEWERYHAGKDERAEIALTEREEMVAERAAVQAAELTASRIAEQVAKELSGEVLHSSPISPHCEAVLEKPPLCHDFRGVRAYAMCFAWKLMDESKLSALPMKEAWQQVRRACRKE